MIHINFSSNASANGQAVCKTCPKMGFNTHPIGTRTCAGFAKSLGYVYQCEGKRYSTRTRARKARTNPQSRIEIVEKGM